MKKVFFWGAQKPPAFFDSNLVQDRYQIGYQKFDPLCLYLKKSR